MRRQLEPEGRVLGRDGADAVEDVADPGILQRGRPACDAGPVIGAAGLSQPQSQKEAVTDGRRDAERVGGVCVERAAFRDQVSCESALARLERLYCVVERPPVGHWSRRRCSGCGYQTAETGRGYSGYRSSRIHELMEGIDRW